MAIFFDPFSCFGAVMPTQSTSGSASLMLATTAIPSSADHGRKGGESTPHHFRPGNSRCNMRQHDNALIHVTAPVAGSDLDSNDAAGPAESYCPRNPHRGVHPASAGRQGRRDDSYSM